MEAGEFVGGVSVGDAARSLWAVVRRSPGLGRRATSFTAETAEILVGRDGL